jgi:hypothetical protein
MCQVLSIMRTAPKGLRTILSPTLRPQIVHDIAAVLAAAFRDVRIDPTDASEAQGRRLHRAINPASGRKQSKKPSALGRTVPAPL